MHSKQLKEEKKKAGSSFKAVVQGKGNSLLCDLMTSPNITEYNSLHFSGNFLEENKKHKS